MKLISSKISTMLLKIRVSKGLSQTFMAHSLQISQKSYSNLESGKCKLDLIRFLKIAECTEIHPMHFIDKIVEGNPSWDSINKREKELIDENEKLKAEINYLRSIISFNQNTIVKSLDKIIVNQESLSQM